jgi:hypothetical protein
MGMHNGIKNVGFDRYPETRGYTLSNTEKGRLGEEAFSESLFDFAIIRNIMFGKRQNDIDHLVLTADNLVFNECKNTNVSFIVFYSWFLSHILARFVDGLPIVQFFARMLGYSVNQIKYMLVIPKLNTDHLVIRSLNALKIEVIETGKQVLSNDSKKDWIKPVRSVFLSVINNPSSLYGDLFFGSFSRFSCRYFCNNLSFYGG